MTNTAHDAAPPSELDLAAPVFRGEQSIMQGVQNGMFCPMGDGDVPVAEVVTELEDAGGLLLIAEGGGDEDERSGIG